MTGAPLWVWLILGVVLLGLLAFDLFSHRGHDRSHRTDVVWSVVWVGTGLAFGGFVWATLGSAAAGEYLAAWLIEKSLSVDNLFVFLVVFRLLGIPVEHQRTVLTWGVLGALVFRALLVFAGLAALERWHWVAYGFGAILIWAAVRIVREDPGEGRENHAVSWLARHLPVTKDLHGGRFFARENGRRVVTPLFLAVCGLELTDIVFALDSVPAALSVSRSAFVVYSSNVFAILGLRSLYMVLAHLLTELKYLRFGLGAVLAFAGLKLMLSKWIQLSPWLSIAVVVVLLGASVWPSLMHRRRATRDP